jgi:hypothetical protein
MQGRRMLLRWMYNNPQSVGESIVIHKSVGGSTIIHKGAGGGRSTKKGDGD